MREEVLYVIFLDLTKAYDALNRSRCLDILEGYGVGPSARRLLQTYWRHLTMVTREGGYYGEAFKGARGVTQGDLLDAVVRHWIEGLVTETAEKGETGREGRHHSAVFYADDGVVFSSEPAWIQGTESALVPGGFWTRQPYRCWRRTPPTGVVPPFLSLPFPQSLPPIPLSSA